MRDLTVDVCVLISGSGMGDGDYEEISRELMLRMINRQEYKLAIDERGKIAEQYSRKCKGTSFGQYFFQSMEARDKIETIEWKGLNQGIRVKLEEKGFTRDNEDYKYVVVASGSRCKKLVSHEGHFFNIRRILRRLEISIFLPDEA